MKSFLFFTDNNLFLYFSYPANVAYFLITIDGITYNQTMEYNLDVILETIEKSNSKLLCSNQTPILLLENSIQDFYAPCSSSQM